MLSDHTKKRDQQGLPCIINSREIRVAGKEYSKDDVERIDAWNVEHVQPGRLLKQARSPCLDINFVQRWVTPQLNLPSSAIALSRANAIVNPSNDRSVQEKFAFLQQSLRDAIRRREEVTGASAILLELALSDILDKYSPRAPTSFKGFNRLPQGFLRVWGAESHTQYDEELGFRCSS